MENMIKDQGSDRRSSVRVRSLLPCSIRTISDDEIDALQARILDLAVVESDGILHDVPDWSERTDELSRDLVFLLNEIRALRQQVTEMQRLVERQSHEGMEPRWIEINDRGLWVPARADDEELETGQFVEIRMQIPSIHTPEILAVGEVLRRDEDEEERGWAIVFRYISQTHSKAIIRYALRRERQLARSVRFH